jgi:uncharacterized YigZ family protein
MFSINYFINHFLVNTYLTIGFSSESIFKISGSKHLSFAFPIQTEQEAVEIIKHFKMKFIDATHHCYAYKISDNIYKINDDGEPSGTAGKPIYGQILSAGITNVLIIVVRYFGGTKLGTGGLIEAYKTAAKLVIEASEVVEKDFLLAYELNFYFLKLSLVMKLVKEIGAIQISQSFDNKCNLKIKIKKRNQQTFLQKIEIIGGLVLV